MEGSFFHDQAHIVSVFIMLTHLFVEDSSVYHFYIVNLGFTGVYSTFNQNIDCGSSKEYPQFFFSKNKKNITNFHFTAVKVAVYCKDVLTRMFYCLHIFQFAAFFVPEYVNNILHMGMILLLFRFLLIRRASC